MFVMFFGGVVRRLRRRGARLARPARRRAASRQRVAGSTGGNLEGKEQRFGIAGSALFDVVTTVTSCGAVNSSIESYTGLGGAVPIANLSASEVIFGGVGTGLYSMLLYVLLAVFIGGLMVGRTPEYLGKKIEAQGDQARLARRPHHAAQRALLHRARDRQHGRARVDLVRRRRARRASPRASTPTSRRPTTTARRSPATPASSSPTPATSARTASPSPTCSAASTMLFARYAPILFALAVAGALAGKRVSPAGLGTMRTDNPTFVVLLIGVIILVGALTFFPALLLGPIVQALTPHLY